jgi:hypothetical protein
MRLSCSAIVFLTLSSICGAALAATEKPVRNAYDFARTVHTSPGQSPLAAKRRVHIPRGASKGFLGNPVVKTATTFTWVRTIKADGTLDRARPFDRAKIASGPHMLLNPKKVPRALGRNKVVFHVEKRTDGSSEVTVLGRLGTRGKGYVAIVDYLQPHQSASRRLSASLPNPTGKRAGYDVAHTRTKPSRKPSVDRIELYDGARRSYRERESFIGSSSSDAQRDMSWRNPAKWAEEAGALKQSVKRLGIPRGESRAVQGPPRKSSRK